MVGSNRNRGLGWLQRASRRFSWFNFLAVMLSILLSAVCITALILVIMNYLNTRSDSVALGTQDFILIIGALFTFSSLIIALFGIVSYFQSAEGLRRLTEVEIGFQSSARELTVMRVFLLLLSSRRVMGIVQSARPALALLHLFKIADAKDAAMDDGETAFEIQVSFIEIMKIGGLPACKGIVNVLDNLSLDRTQYRTCVAQLKRLVRYYEPLMS